MRNVFNRMFAWLRRAPRQDAGVKRDVSGDTSTVVTPTPGYVPQQCEGLLFPRCGDTQDDLITTYQRYKRRVEARAIRVDDLISMR